MIHGENAPDNEEIARLVRANLSSVQPGAVLSAEEVANLLQGGILLMLYDISVTLDTISTEFQTIRQKLP